MQHSIEGIQALGIPTHGSLVLGVLSADVPGVEVGLELGHCYFRVNMGETKSSEKERNQSSYAVNMTNYCPALQVRKLRNVCVFKFELTEKLADLV